MPLSPQEPFDSTFMLVALDQARRALAHDDVPIGAAVVVSEEVVAVAHNQREALGDPTAHAEILALRGAADALGSRVLAEATVYVTLEPCPMCAGALVLARGRRLVYGPQDPRAGAAMSLYNIVADERLNHRLEVTPDVMAEESTALLRDFFATRRGG